MQSVSKFTEIIKLFSEDGSSYTNKWVKNLLESKYGSFVEIKSEGKGKQNIIIFRDASKQFEKKVIIKSTANIIKGDLANIEKTTVYPSPDDLNDESKLSMWLPKSLLDLLEPLIPNPLKRVAIGHAIASASNTKIHSPLLFGLGVQLDHSFGSKWLNKHLSQLGFSINNN